MKKYYSLEELDKLKNIQYYIIFGERSNGKSYAVDKRMIDNYFTKGEEFVICKRFAEDIKTNICATMLEPLYDYVLETYGYMIRFYRGIWYTYPKDENFKISECEVMGYALSLSNSDRIKGSQFPRVKTILMEEFMSMGNQYLDDEVNKLLNLVSTVARNRVDVKIYLLGNAISKHSPYSNALGIRLHRMKHGEILTKEYFDKKGRKTRFAIQRTPNVDVFDCEENVDGVVYNVFGNNGVGKMITSGEFETHSYNKESCGVTFNENIRILPKLKYHCFGRDDRLPIIIRYEDYYYNIYRKRINNNVVFGFRETDRKFVTGKNIYFLINNNEYFKDITNINNIMYYSCKNQKINKIFDELVQSFRQNTLVFLNDDNGEDVHNALSIVGLC